MAAALPSDWKLKEGGAELALCSVCTICTICTISSVCTICTISLVCLIYLFCEYDIPRISTDVRCNTVTLLSRFPSILKKSCIGRHVVL